MLKLSGILEIDKYPSICGVYRIRNNVDKKSYIGSSIDVRHRVNKHRTDLLANRHHNYLLQEAFVKYGIDVFEVTLIEKINNSNNNERFAIETGYLHKAHNENWDNYYNLSLEAEDMRLGNNERTVWKLDYHTGEVLKEYYSAMYAGRQNDIDSSTISHCALRHETNGKKGRGFSGGGYGWTYDKNKPYIAADLVKEIYKERTTFIAAARSIPIYKVDPYTYKVVKKYDSITDAEKDNYTPIRPDNVLNKGFIYVKKPRKKYGIEKLLKYDKEGNLLAAYTNFSDAARECKEEKGLSISVASVLTNIGKATNEFTKKRKPRTAYGYVWKTTTGTVKLPKSIGSKIFGLFKK